MSILLDESVSFRSELRASDAAIVAELVRATGFFSAEEVDVARTLVEEALANGRDSFYRFLFAEQDSLLGYTCFGRVPLTLSSYDLYWIVVTPPAQRGGLGSRLLRRTEQAIAALGGEAIYVETSGRPQYAPTRDFYLRCGFREAARFEDFYAPGDAKLVFERRCAAG